MKKKSDLFNLIQGSQTRAPEASCGPQDGFVWLAYIWKTDKSIEFDQILRIFKKFGIFWELFL